MGPAEIALGIERLHSGEGTARLAMTITETMINVHGIGHGGYVFLLADSAFAVACNSPGSVTVAAQAEIDFIAAVRLGDELVAEAVERVTFGRSGIYDITVTRGDEVVAEFRGRSRTIR
ncbi:hydroxyphenylacetyl-CoA thioesterase PaaI [Umezawaea sp.]|uniref:hydroxyphenylacetyl-CoA thioesterase PaaI n=1 Tax=Umezawaea sp. TaxID=1955258 RepID=UPI002ED4CF2E